MRITANKIDEWANSLDCKAKLPLLIRKLIYESINDISKCKFPSLEQTTSSSGFDGILESNEQTQYIPNGISVWEMGCNKDKKGKADDDYDKRKENPLNTTPEKTVYMQISPRKWKDEKIKEWIEEKKEDDFWKDVVLLDAKDLEEWINNLPNVEQWFAEELGFPNEGVQTLNQWWEKWSSVTHNMQFTSKLVLTNKENESEKLKKYLETSKHVKVKSSTIEESIAFLYSVIDTLPITQKEYYLNKILIIDNVKTFDFYSQYDLILIPTFEFTYNANMNSFVYMPISNEDPTSADISLKDMIRFDLMESLNKNMKISYELSRKYANASGGNISILRHLLSPKSLLPPWFDENLMEILITLFIVQSWDENNLNDIEIIEEISGLTYKDFTRKLMILLNKPNTPLIKNKNIWILKSPQHLFFLIAPYVTKFDIDNQYNTFLRLFKISNYDDDLLNENYSKNIKEGISKSIILIDINKNNTDLNCDPIIIWKLLKETFKDENNKFWNYNSPYLPLFAEISPDDFIENVKNTLNENKEYIGNLFKGTNYTFLLSSLELCSRNPSLFNTVVDILIELMQFEYDDKYYNSPFNSLKELFIPWIDHNSSFLSLRLNKLDKIMLENNEIGWNLLKFLLSRQSKVSSGIRNAIYRDFTKIQRGITQKEVDEYNSIIERKTIDYLDENIDNYCFLIDQYRITPNNEYKQKIIEKIEKYNDSENSVVLWNALLDSAYWMKRKNESKKYSDDIKKLEEISEKFKPEDIIKRSEWAFNCHFIRTSNATDRRNEMECERQNIISNIITEKGFKGIKTLIQNVELPELIGYYVSEEVDDEVLDLLNTDEKNTKFAMSYIGSKSHDNFKWVEKSFEKIKDKDGEILINFFISIFPNEKNWALLNRCNPTIIEEYWKQCRNYSYNTKEGCMTHITNLMKHSRYADAAESIYHSLEKLDTNFIGDTLLSISKNDSYNHDEYIIDIILKNLHDDNYDREKIMKLEFRFSECYLVDPPEYSMIIHEELAKNTELFSKLVTKLDKGDFTFNYRFGIILDNMRIIPGTDETNNINIDSLRKWIHECEDKLNNTYHLYYRLANLFANTPEEDENWPKKEICQIIDELDNEILNIEFPIAIFNKNGMKIKNIFEGGKNEIKLAEKYHNYANSILNTYPITAKSLIDASERFYESAKFEDYMSVNNNWRF